MFDAAYRDQETLVRRLVAGGETVRGWKIGATSGAVQARLSTSEPFYAALLGGREVAAEGSVECGATAEVLLECEVAFVLERHMSGPGVTGDMVQRCARGVRAAFDIIAVPESKEPRSVVDVIRSNGSTLAFVLGAQEVDPRMHHPAQTMVVLRKGGEALAQGTGRGVMGNPCAAVAWLANRLGLRGSRISAGQVVLSGSMTAPCSVAPGDELEADFGDLGRLVVRFQ